MQPRRRVQVGEAWRVTVHEEVDAAHLEAGGAHRGKRVGAQGRIQLDPLPCGLGVGVEERGPLPEPEDVITDAR